MTRVSTVLVYVIQDDKVLLLHRNKEPNLGLWVAPGGKIELHESPREAAFRELREETGLVADELTWRGLCTEVSPRPEWQWMLFIYVASRVHGRLQEDPREGRLAWVDLDVYLRELDIPEADRIFAPVILENSDRGMIEAKFTYDGDLRLIAWEFY